VYARHLGAEHLQIKGLNRSAGSIRLLDPAGDLALLDAVGQQTLCIWLIPLFILVSSQGSLN